MKLSRVAVGAAALLGSAMLAPTADAHGYRHRSSVGIYVGVPGPYYYRPYYDPRAYYYPRYYYPYPYYYAPVYGAPAPAYPPVYIEQSAPAAAPAPSASSGYWYYCRDTQTYYPYVQQCASQWQEVVPNGPRS